MRAPEMSGPEMTATEMTATELRATENMRGTDTVSTSSLTGAAGVAQVIARTKELHATNEELQEKAQLLENEKKQVEAKNNEI